MVTLDYLRTTAAGRHVRRLQGPSATGHRAQQVKAPLRPDSEDTRGLKALFPNTRKWCCVWFLRVST